MAPAYNSLRPELLGRHDPGSHRVRRVGSPLLHARYGRQALGNQGLVTGSGVGSATITATQGGVSGATTVTVTPAVLTSIAITPPDPSLAKGTSCATYCDRNLFGRDYSGSHRFGELDLVAARLQRLPTRSTALVTGTGVGSATVTATQAGVSGTATVTVTPAVLTSIAITPPDPSIAKGTSCATYCDRDLFGREYSGSHRFGELDFVVRQAWQRLPTQQRPGDRDGSGERSDHRDSGGSVGHDHRDRHTRGTDLDRGHPPNPSIAKGTSVQLTATGDLFGRDYSGSHRFGELDSSSAGRNG